MARLEGVVEELDDRNGLAMPSLAHHFARVVTERNEARDAVRAEREACVLVIQNTMGASNIGTMLVRAIRARGER